MIGYVCLGTNDLEAAKRFYDALLGVINAKRIWETERFVAWGHSETQPMLLIIKPFDNSKATVGNGTMVALAVSSRADVDALHSKALALGCKDEGAVGNRAENFYAGYFRELEGHKFAVFFAG
jgi:predicted lactoylglutathione lyase